MKTQKLFDELVKNGLNHVQEEYREGQNRWEMVGRALSEIADSSRGMARLAYVFFESFNVHNVCSLLNWVFNLYEYHHAEDFNNIKGLIEGRVYNVHGWDLNDGVKKYRAKVEFIEVTEEE